MLKYRLCLFFAAVVLSCAASLPLCADTPQENNKLNLSSRFQKKWGSHPIKVRQQIYSPRISGSFPSNKTVKKCAERFYITMEYLPESLIRKSGVKYVTFLNNLKLNGKNAGGIASGNTIYLPVKFETGTVFHEFFHIFDPKSNNADWRKLNDKKFTYTGSKFYKINRPKKEERKIKKNNSDDDIEDSFVSSYAMSFEQEDRAETFAFMIVEGRKFLKRTKNPVIKAKMEYIMELFIQKKLLPKEFWEKHFDRKFNLKNRFYNPSAQ